MKSRTSVIIGTVMLIIAGGFVAFAMQHPELSFLWSQRVTFMMAVVFLAMEMTCDTVNIYILIRGFIVVGACDVAIENICKKIEKGESADEKK